MSDKIAELVARLRNCAALQDRELSPGLVDAANEAADALDRPLKVDVEDALDCLRVIARRRGVMINQGDVLGVQLALDCLTRLAR